jgi:hypothetical protein
MTIDGPLWIIRAERTEEGAITVRPNPWTEQRTAPWSRHSFEFPMRGKKSMTEQRTSIRIKVLRTSWRPLTFFQCRSAAKISFDSPSAIFFSRRRRRRSRPLRNSVSSASVGPSQGISSDRPRRWRIMKWSRSAMTAASNSGGDGVRGRLRVGRGLECAGRSSSSAQSETSDRRGGHGSRRGRDRGGTEQHFLMATG